MSFRESLYWLFAAIAEEIRPDYVIPQDEDEQLEAEVEYLIGLAETATLNEIIEKQNLEIVQLRTELLNKASETQQEANKALSDIISGRPQSTEVSFQTKWPFEEHRSN